MYCHITFSQQIAILNIYSIFDCESHLWLHVLVQYWQQIFIRQRFTARITDNRLITVYLQVHRRLFISLQQCRRHRVYVDLYQIFCTD